MLYKFTITAKLGFMYHIPGPDEDPDDPKTNTCPLDPVLENKLNMLAALPKQIFGMLVPKELPDVRALMPYSLRLPHARDALDCKFDRVGSVSFSHDELDEIRSFHAAMMEGPQKKKDPKKVAEELKKLTEAARIALGEDLPAADSAPQAADSVAEPQPQAGSQLQAPTDQAAAPAASPAAPSAEAMYHDHPPSSSDTPSVNPSAADTQQPSTAASDSATPADTADQDHPSTAKQVEPVKPDELNKFKEGDDEGEEDKFMSNYFVVPLQQWMDWEDPNHAMDDSFPDIDWEAVKHVKYGWKPLSTLEKVDSPPAGAPGDPMDVDGDQPVPDSDHLIPSTSTHTQMQPEAAQPSICTGTVDFTILEADGPIPAAGTVSYRIISTDAATPGKGTATFAVSDEEQAVVSKGTAVFTYLHRDSAIPSGVSTASPEVRMVPSQTSTGPAGDDADPVLADAHPQASLGETSTPSGDATIPSSSTAGIKLGQLDPHRLTNAVVVTTYNSTPYFFEGIDPELTPQSKFPDDKLKLQLAVEEEEEDEFLKPKPKEADTPTDKPKEADTPTDRPKETDTPTDKPADQPENSADTAQGGESAADVATAVVVEELDPMVAKVAASKKAATFTEYFK